LTGVFQISDVAGPGATPTLVTRPQQTDELHRFPSFLDDGVHFVYTVIKDSLVRFEIGALDGTPSTEVYRTGMEGVLGRGMTQAYVAGGRLVFASKGAVWARTLEDKPWRLSNDPVLLHQYVDGDPGPGSQAFAASDNTFVYRTMPRPPSQLTWFTRDGIPAGSVWEPGFMQSVQLSPDETRAAVACSDGEKLNLWAIDPRGGEPPRRLTVGSGSPVLWSPDSTRIWFRNPTDAFKDHIYSIFADGRGDQKLAADRPEGSSVPLGWTRSGSLLYAGTRYAKGKPLSDLWELSLSGDAHVLIPAEKTKINFSSAAVTRNGDLIASVVAGTVVGQSTLYVQPIRPDVTPTLVESGKIESPRWRADGHELYYLSAGRMMVAEISDDASRASPGHVLFPFQGRFYSPSRDGMRFLVANPPASWAPSSVGVDLNWINLHSK
jgi:hypothetical protein